MLDPANPQALDNLRASRKAYDSAYPRVQQHAAGTPLAADVRQLQDLRAAQVALQDEVVSLARSFIPLVMLNLVQHPSLPTGDASIRRHGP